MKNKFSWKAFISFGLTYSFILSYLKAKTQTGVNKKRELYLSGFLTLLFFFGIIYSVPPFKYVMDFGAYLTASWEKVEEASPIPHAELLTLNELALQLKLSSVDEITRKLIVHNIRFDNAEQTLQEI